MLAPLRECFVLDVRVVDAERPVSRTVAMSIVKQPPGSKPVWKRVVLDGTSFI